MSDFEQAQISQPVRLVPDVASGAGSSHENYLSRNGATVSDILSSSDSTLAETSSTGLSFSTCENAIDNGVAQAEGSCRCFSLDEILIATHTFDDAYIIGIGGFGKVYQGFIDNGATVVAIKRLNAESKQGAGEFWTEVKMLSKLRHTHLVALIGYCDECQEMLLVYEYIPHGTLASHLCKLSTTKTASLTSHLYKLRTTETTDTTTPLTNHLYKLSTTETDTTTTPLTWEQRLNICIGAAQGLHHLHAGTNQSFIHRDVKSANILLDENWVAKISDFGLSKGTTSHSITHISTNVKGTFGYFDPDYFITQRLTTKSDVYAFGVVLLEVLCGRPPVDTRAKEDEIGLVHWAQHCIKKGKLDRIVDPSLHGQISPRCLKSFVELANNCLQKSPKSRPSMAEVLGSLQLALVSQHRGRTERIITKPFQIMTDWWLREREREGLSSSSGQSQRTMAEVLRSLDLEIVSEKRGRREGIIAKMFQIITYQRLRERDGIGSSNGQLSMDEALRRLELALVSRKRERKKCIIAKPFHIMMDRWFRDRKGISFPSGESNDSPQELDSNSATRSYHRFSLAEIRVATNDFNKSLLVPNTNKVYKGCVKIEGKAHIVVIKRRKKVEGVPVGSHAKTLPLHPHVVSLIGFCREGHELILVYDYAANGSLEDYLHRTDTPLLRK